jgi:hypothetical protein
MAAASMSKLYQMSDAAARTLGIAILPFGVREPEERPSDVAAEPTRGIRPDAAT